jgi:hypothetical protein
MSCRATPLEADATWQRKEVAEWPYPDGHEAAGKGTVPCAGRFYVYIYIWLRMVAGTAATIPTMLWPEQAGLAVVAGLPRGCQDSTTYEPAHPPLYENRSLV